MANIDQQLAESFIFANKENYTSVYNQLIEEAKKLNEENFQIFFNFSLKHSTWEKYIIERKKIDPEYTPIEKKPGIIDFLFKENRNTETETSEKIEQNTICEINLFFAEKYEFKKKSDFINHIKELYNNASHLNRFSYWVLINCIFSKIDWIKYKTERKKINPSFHVSVFDE